MRIVSQKLRDSARGKDCTLRIPGICNHNPETTVLAHLPCGQKGMGMKGPDLIAVFACSSCHDLIDGRAPGEVAADDLLRALAETQMSWVAEGTVKIAGMR